MENGDPARAGALRAIVLVVGIALALAGCRLSVDGAAPGTIAATAAYAAARHGDALLIDVREADEIAQGAPAATAARIVYRLDRSRDAQFVDAAVVAVAGDRATPVILICATGVRSAAARDLLLTQGFTAVTSLDGGFRSWQADRLPVVPQASTSN